MIKLPDYKNPITTKENINELHHILVQTCLDYMIKNNLTDIDEINFSVDGLGYSYKHGEWTAATDSSIEVIGLNMEKHTIQSGKRAGKEIELPVRALIGFQC